MCFCSSGPANDEPYAFAFVNDVDNNSIDHLPEYLLPVDYSGTRRIPKCWNVRGETSNLCSLFLLQQARLIPDQTLVLLLKRSLLPQLLFPLPLKLPRYEPVLWLYVGVPSNCSIRFVLSPLQSLLPEPANRLTLAFNAGGRFETHFE